MTVITVLKQVAGIAVSCYECHDSNVERIMSRLRRDRNVALQLSAMPVFSRRAKWLIAEAGMLREGCGWWRWNEDEIQLRTARQYDAKPTTRRSVSSTPNVISSKSIVKPSSLSSSSPRPSTPPFTSTSAVDRCRCPVAGRSTAAVASKPLRRRVDVAVGRYGVGHNQSSICLALLLSAVANTNTSQRVVFL